MVGWPVGDKMCWFQVILLTLNLAPYRELGEGRLLIKIATWEGSAYCKGTVGVGPIIADN